MRENNFNLVKKSTRRVKSDVTEIADLKTQDRIRSIEDT